MTTVHKPPAPVMEIGYQVANPYYWWLYENETTPELVWPQSVYVYDQMRRTDAQVGSVLRAVTLPVVRTPWRINPNGARKEVVELVANDLGLPIVGQEPKAAPRTRDKFSWSVHLTEALLMLPLGYSYFEQVYRVDPDGARAHLRKLALRPARSIQKVNVDSDGGLISIEQYWAPSDPQSVPIPVSRLVAYVHAKEGGNWLGTSILRNCYKNWLLKDRLLRVQAQTIERNGMGIPLYKAGPDETNLAPGLAMAKAWRAGDAAGTALPHEADLILRGVEGTLPDAEPAIRYHDEQIARAVLAHFLNLGTQTGSWALGTTFADFFVLSLQTLAQQIADTATCHVVEDLVDVNWGPDEPAPRLTFDEIGSRQQSTAEALKLLVDAGVVHPDDILETSTRQQYGLPPKDPNAPPPGPLPGLVRETLTNRIPGGDTPTPAQPAQFSQSVAAAGESGPKALTASAADPDDADWDEWDEWEEHTDALTATVLGALAQAQTDRVVAKYNPDELRVPGGKGGGRWTANPVSRAIADALKALAHGDHEADPFVIDGKPIDREALRRAGVARGLTFKRGESRENIVKALVGSVQSPAGPTPQIHDMAGVNAHLLHPDHVQGFQSRLNAGEDRSKLAGDISDHGTKVFNGVQGRAQTDEDRRRFGAWSMVATRVRAANTGPVDAEEASRVRLAQVQHAKSVAELLTDAEQISHDEASEKAFRARVEGVAKRNSLPQSMVDDLVAAHGDHDRLTQTVDRIAAENGLTRVGGRTGAVEPFDRKLHEPIDRIEPGKPAEVVHPAYEAKLPGGDSVKLGRAKVMSSDEPLPKAKVAKKATPSVPKAPVAKVTEDGEPPESPLVTLGRVQQALASGGDLGSFSDGELNEAFRMAPEGPQSDAIKAEIDLRRSPGEAPSAGSYKPVSGGVNARRIAADLGLTRVQPSVLDTVQRLLDGEEGFLGKNPSPAAVGRYLEKWANGPSGPYYKSATLTGVNQDDMTADIKAQADAYHRDGDEWVALARALQATRRTGGATPAPSTRQRPSGPKAAVPRLPAAEKARPEGVPAAAGVGARLNSVASVDEATAYLNSLDLSKDQLTQLAKDLEVPLARNTKPGIVADIVKVRVAGRLTTQVIHNAPFGSTIANSTPKGKVTLSDIRQATSRSDAEALLKPHTKAELQALAREAGVPFTSKATKPTLVSALLDEVGHGGDGGIIGSLDAGELLGSGDESARDSGMRAILKRQGFDGPPTLTDTRGVDAVIKAGGIELFRGTSPAGAEQFRIGPFPLSAPDASAHGSGVYAGGTEEAAKRFGVEGGLLRMALKPDAKVITQDELRAERRRLSGNWSTDQNVLYSDDGRLAAALGYDAIGYGGNRPQDRNYVILNRTALTVENAPAHLDEVGHGDSVAAKRSREVEVESAIRDAYDRVQARSVSGKGAVFDKGAYYVQLADLRDELGEKYPRAEIDDALRRMNRQSGIDVVPDDAQGNLTQADRDSAVQIGGVDHHMVRIEPKTTRRRRAPGG